MNESLLASVPVKQNTFEKTFEKLKAPLIVLLLSPYASKLLNNSIL